MSFMSAEELHKLQNKISTAFATEDTEFTENYHDMRRLPPSVSSVISVAKAVD
jgi:hypothetical protein